MPDRPALVVFDCDGVLVDTEGPQAVVLAAVLAEHGAPVTPADVLGRYKGFALEAIEEDLDARAGVVLPASWQQEFRDRRGPAFERDGIPAIPGVRDVVEALVAAGIPYGVASQGRLDKTAMTLRLSGLADLFPEAVRFSADQVERPKPAPDLFLLAARTLGGPPSGTVVVEDSVPGVTAARAAGMRILGHAADEDPEDLRAAGAEPFAAMADLPTLLGL
ncbi:HAD family phosphatase [Patulibacter sp. NPDC049589]|uniref:HAD family hydrolase n=1 Tax=Patulibacter sp. NPDC049589 TaxID=3154731 RepID=UPI0034146765